MNDYEYDFDREEELNELRMRVERKRNKAARKRLAKAAQFDLYVEESNPLDLELEVGYSFDNKDWDE